MTELRENMIADMTAAGLSTSTKEVYVQGPPWRISTSGATDGLRNVLKWAWRQLDQGFGLSPLCERRARCYR